MSTTAALINKSNPKSSSYVSFTPAALFTSLEQGVWYDPSDIATMFEDAAGTTRVHIPGNGTPDSPVGKILDKRVGYSVYFDGTGDYIYTTTTTALQMSGDFTWEAWIYPQSNAATGQLKCIWSQRGTTATIGGPIVGFDSAGVLFLYISNDLANSWSVNAFNTGLSVTLNTWQHLALVKSGTTIKLYKNGIAGNSTTHSTAVGTNGTNTVIMAGAADGSQAVNGFMSNFRIVKGTAVYTSNFTPSTSALTAITNTSLLTCGVTWSGNPTLTFAGNTRNVYGPTPFSIGNDATQTTSGSRPILSARYNLLTGTSVLSNQTVSTLATNYKLTFSGNGAVDLSGSASGTYTSGINTISCISGNLAFTVSGNVNNADFRANDDTLNLPLYQNVVDANTYDSVGFPYYLNFDGVDDCLYTSGVDFTNTDKVSVFGSFRRSADGGVPVEFGTDASTTGSFHIYCGDSTGITGSYWTAGSVGTTGQDAQATGYSAPSKDVVSAIFDISAPSIKLRVDGSQVSTNTSTQGTGTFGNYSLYFGRRNNNSSAYNGRSYGLIVRGASTVPNEIVYAEEWLNEKTSAYSSSKTFSPADLFANGEEGVWYDASDLTTLFEDAGGRTQCHQPGNGTPDSEISLWLDKSKGWNTSTLHAEGDGVATQSFSAPYKSISTANLDIQVRYSPFSGTASAGFTQQTFYSQDTGSGTTRNFIFYVTNLKVLTLIWWDSGGTQRTATASTAATINYGSTYWIRATLLANNGASGHDVKFYVDPDTGNNTPPASPTQLGTTVNAGAFTTSIRSTAATTSYVGANGAANYLNGKIYYASVSATIGGSAVQTFTPTDYTRLSSTVTSSSGDVWTLGSGARIVPDGNHLVQPTQILGAGFRRRPRLSARVNLLTYSEQFDNAIWTKSNSSVTANAVNAPDGALTADFLQEDNVNQHHYIAQTANVSTADSSFSSDNVGGADFVRFSVCGKAGTRDKIVLQLSFTGGQRYSQVFDLATGTADVANQFRTGSLTRTYYTIDPLANGWYRCSIFVTNAGIGGGAGYIGISDANSPSLWSASGMPQYTGDGNSGLYIWGAEIRHSTHGSRLPVYQRIADYATYDTNGFPNYVRFFFPNWMWSQQKSNVPLITRLTVVGFRDMAIASEIYVQRYFAVLPSAPSGSDSGSADAYVLRGRNNTFNNRTMFEGGTGAAYTLMWNPVLFGTNNTPSPSTVMVEDKRPGVGYMRVNGAVYTFDNNFTEFSATSGAGFAIGPQYSNGFAAYDGGNASSYLRAAIYGIILRGASSTATEVLNAEKWMNDKMLAY